MFHTEWYGGVWLIFVSELKVLFKPTIRRKNRNYSNSLCHAGLYSGNICRDSSSDLDLVPSIVPQQKPLAKGNMFIRGKMYDSSLIIFHLICCVKKKVLWNTQSKIQNSCAALRFVVLPHVIHEDWLFCEVNKWNVGFTNLNSYFTAPFNTVNF